MSDNQATNNQALNNQALNNQALNNQATNNQTSNGSLGAVLGALIAAALAIFLLSGGEHFGKTTIHGDADLPPVETVK